MTIQDANRYVVDTNVIVHANAASSPWHQLSFAAIESYRQAGVDLWISRQILREYLAVVTRPQIRATPLTPTVAAARVRFFAQTFRVVEDGADSDVSTAPPGRRPTGKLIASMPTGAWT